MSHPEFFGVTHVIFGALVCISIIKLQMHLMKKPVQ